MCEYLECKCECHKVGNEHVLCYLCNAEPPATMGPYNSLPGMEEFDQKHATEIGLWPAINPDPPAGKGLKALFPMQDTLMTEGREEFKLPPMTPAQFKMFDAAVRREMARIDAERMEWMAKVMSDRAAYLLAEYEFQEFIADR